MNNYRIFEYSYQKHIDAIRALAVLVVWLFHLNPNLFPGGYVGVDIFFVVSGYVITLSIFRDIEKNNNFNLFKFYKKRFFRIFPALFFLIISTFIFYLFFGYLFELNYVSKIGIASLFGISNIFYIYLKSDYFLENELNPFLHTWSLGVEEQFYFMYPLIISSTLLLSSYFYKKKINFLLILTFVFLIILSFLCFYLFQNTTLGNFYSPLSRFWELLIGCLLFLVFENKKINFNKIIIFTAIILFFFIIFFDDLISNIYLTLPLVIIFASITIISNKNITNYFNNYYFLYLGKISYSLYLWHLPVLYFTKIYLQGFIFLVANIVIVLILSLISFHLVEKIFRYSHIAQRIFLLIIFGLFISLSLFIISNVKINQNLNFNNLYNNQLNNLSNFFKNYNIFELNYNLSYRTNWNVSINNQNISKCENSNSTFNINRVIDQDCLIKNSTEKIFIINGDSHATHYFPMINNLNLNRSIYLKTFEGCMFIPNIYVISKENYKNKIFKNYYKCQEYISQQITNIKNMETEFKDVYLILSSRYSAYINQFLLMNKNKVIFDNDKIYEIIFNSLNELMYELKNIKIILISPLPEFNHYPYSCFLNKKMCNNDLVSDLKRVELLNKVLEKISSIHDNVYLFNPYNKICNLDKSFCSMYDSQKDILFFKDTDHLTVEGSSFLTKYFELFFNKNLIN